MLFCGDPVVQCLRRKPRAGFDFFRVKVKRAFVLAAIDPDEFLTGLFASVNAQDPVGHAGESHSEFFVDFAHGASVVILAGVEVTRG